MLLAAGLLLARLLVNDLVIEGYLLRPLAIAGLVNLHNGSLANEF